MADGLFGPLRGPLRHPTFGGSRAVVDPPTAHHQLSADRLTEESCLPEFVSPTRTHGLVDILDRVLDKGLVIAGDIKINLANVELLTIQVRLLVCSIDKAEQIGLNWWRYDTNLTRAATAEAENVELRERVAALEREIRQLGEAPGRAAGARIPRPRAARKAKK